MYNFDNNPDLKSPFLRAILRTHTIQKESYDPLILELEMARNECQEAVKNKTILDMNLANEKQLRKEKHRNLCEMFIKTMRSMDSDLQSMNKFSNNVLAKVNDQIDIYRGKIKQAAGYLDGRQRELEVCGMKNVETQRMLQEHCESHLSLNSLESSLHDLTKEHSDGNSHKTIDIHILDIIVFFCCWYFIL